jgi:CubicO group peptidase (beta-lactamase class C family)
MTAITHRVDQLFADWDTAETPGCVLGVFQHGELAYHRAYGMADLERDVPLGPDSVLDLGSTGKQFTAMLMLLLEQRDLLSLDDGIRDHVPELPAYASAVTLRHLVHHTSGLYDYPTLMYMANKRFENAYDDDELLDLVVRQRRPAFAAGEQFLYSNTGYLLLGVVAQRVGGGSYPDLVREHILDPLGMGSTTFNDTFSRVVKNRALAYSANVTGFETDISFCGGYGDGAVLSCVGDLLRWDRNFYDNRLGQGGPELIEKMQTPGRLNDETTIDYACGLRVGEHRGLRMISHGGAWAGYRAELVRFPDQQLSVVCLANRSDADPSVRALRVAELYLAARLDESDQAAPSDAPGPTVGVDSVSFAGAYRSSNGGTLLEISSHEDGLRLELEGEVFSLVAAGKGALRTVDCPVEIEMTRDGDDAMSVTLQRGTPDTYRRVQASAADVLAPADYYCDELDIVYRIELDGEQPFVRRGGASREPLKPVSHDLFTSGPLIFELSRNRDGEVVGFELFAGRVAGLRFDRRP